ncbi:MAG: MFS transporter [Alphaproteobacteria bacterium]|nr:MFS transporter [Alphaproteobacteria bacterium]
MSIGSATAYAGIWFASKGLSPEQIGFINSTPVFALLLINIFVGKVADRASDWRQTIIAGAWLAAICALGLFFAHSFWPIMAGWALVSIAQGSIGPVMDAAASRLTSRRGSSFGSLRAWGTIGFVFAIFLTGQLVTFAGGDVFIPLFIALGLLRALISLILPRFKDAGGPSVKAEGMATHILHMMKPWLFAPLLAWATIQSTNMTLIVFQSLMWKQQGLSAGLISNLIALGAIAEAAMMFAAPWLKRHFRARQLILIAGLTAAFRLACFALSPGMPWLIPLQLLHAVTYAVGYLGCMQFITRWTADEMAAEAQGFLVVIQQVVVMLAYTAFGYLMTSYGASAYFASAAMALVGSAVVVGSMLFLPPPGTAKA